MRIVRGDPDGRVAQRNSLLCGKSRGHLGPPIWSLLPDVANELEFQGDVLKWMSLDIKKRPGIGITDVGQEKQYSNQKRSDLVVWLIRDVDALAAIELKTLTTPLSDPIFQND